MGSLSHEIVSEVRFIDIANEINVRLKVFYLPRFGGPIKFLIRDGELTMYKKIKNDT